LNAPAPNNISRQLLIDELESIYASLVADAITMAKTDAALASATSSRTRKDSKSLISISAKKTPHTKTTDAMPITNHPSDTKPLKTATPTEKHPANQAGLLDDDPLPQIQVDEIAAPSSQAKRKAEQQLDILRDTAVNDLDQQVGDTLDSSPARKTLDGETLIESLVDQFLPQIKAELHKRLEETLRSQPNPQASPQPSIKHQQADKS